MLTVVLIVMLGSMPLPIRKRSPQPLYRGLLRRCLDWLSTEAYLYTAIGSPFHSTNKTPSRVDSTHHLKEIARNSMWLALTLVVVYLRVYSRELSPAREPALPITRSKLWIQLKTWTAIKFSNVIQLTNREEGPTAKIAINWPSWRIQASQSPFASCSKRTTPTSSQLHCPNSPTKRRRTQLDCINWIGVWVWGFLTPRQANSPHLICFLYCLSLILNRSQTMPMLWIKMKIWRKVRRGRSRMVALNIQISLTDPTCPRSLLASPSRATWTSRWETLATSRPCLLSHHWLAGLAAASPCHFLRMSWRSKPVCQCCQVGSHRHPTSRWSIESMWRGSSLELWARCLTRVMVVMVR